MKDDEVLVLRQKDSPHTLRLMGYGGGAVGNFQTRKSNDSQTIEIPIVAFCTLSDIVIAWSGADKAWTQQYKKPGGPYEALRTITLANGVIIAWYLFHEKEKPADSLRFWKDVKLKTIAEYYGFTPADFCDLPPIE